MTEQPSLWMPRFWPAMAAFHAGLAFMATFFGATVFLGGTPVTPDLYGPTVYVIPALTWAAAQFFGAMLCVGGAWWQNGWLLSAGSFASVVVYGFFAAAASLAEQGTLVQAATLFVACPGSVLTLIAGLGALRHDR